MRQDAVLDIRKIDDTHFVIKRAFENYELFAMVANEITKMMVTERSA